MLPSLPSRLVGSADCCLVALAWLAWLDSMCPPCADVFLPPFHLQPFATPLSAKCAAKRYCRAPLANRCRAKRTTSAVPHVSAELTRAHDCFQMAICRLLRCLVLAISSMQCDYKPWRMRPSIGAALCQTSASTYQCCPSNQQCKKPQGSIYSVCCPGGEQACCMRSCAVIVPSCLIELTTSSSTHFRILGVRSILQAKCAATLAALWGLLATTMMALRPPPPSAAPAGVSLLCKAPNGLENRDESVFSDLHALSTHHEPLLLHP